MPPTFEFALYFVVDIPSHIVVKMKLKKLISRGNLTMIRYSRLSFAQSA